MTEISQNLVCLYSASIDTDGNRDVERVIFRDSRLKHSPSREEEVCQPQVSEASDEQAIDKAEILWCCPHRRQSWIHPALGG